MIVLFWCRCHEGVHFIHELLDFNDDMVASFSLVSGQLLHLFELSGCDSEFDGFELNRYLLNDLFNNLRWLLLQACVV